MLAEDSKYVEAY